MNSRYPYKTACPFILAAVLAVTLTACGDGGGPDVASGGSTSSASGGSSGPATGNPDGSSNPAGRTRLADLKIGDCTTPSSDDLFVSDMTVIECSQPHKMQVAGRFDYTEASSDAAYPGFLAIQQSAYQQCQPVFEHFTGVAFFESPYDIDTITPSASTWADGDRGAICLIVNIDGEPMLASAR